MTVAQLSPGVTPRRRLYQVIHQGFRRVIDEGDLD
jgi:hypothetical protein